MNTDVPAGEKKGLFFPLYGRHSGEGPSCTGRIFVSYMRLTKSHRRDQHASLYPFLDLSSIGLFELRA
ncbi:hypothetical protein SBC1_40430 (plasmid) [Caballeronia sp. SBC1]|nr:hypothetical protein SBC2_47510 [Caballeronia sp. SBC2]QIN64003.1 hypothetical protein SBC1_40430 [Caballeronia sp. SBC1]